MCACQTCLLLEFLIRIYSVGFLTHCQRLSDENFEIPCSFALALVLLVSLLDFLPPKFVKPKVLSPEVSLQNLTFCRGFPNSEFPRFFGFTSFLR